MCRSAFDTLDDTHKCRFAVALMVHTRETNCWRTVGRRPPAFFIDTRISPETPVLTQRLQAPHRIREAAVRQHSPGV